MGFGKKFKEVHLLYVKSPKSRLCILHPLSYLRQVAPSQRRYSLSEEVLHNIRDLTSSHNFFVTLLARSSPVCSMMHGEESTIKSRNWITFFCFSHNGDVDFFLALGPPPKKTTVTAAAIIKQKSYYKERCKSLRTFGILQDPCSIG